LVVSATPTTDAKTLGLWDRDVAEIFIGPDLNQPERYYEFEAAPTGEWVDLAIRQLPEKRETDFEFHSGVSTAGRIEDGRVIMSMRIPWKVFGFVPRKGQQLAANLFRCIGTDPIAVTLPGARPGQKNRTSTFRRPSGGWSLIEPGVECRSPNYIAKKGGRIQQDCAPFYFDPFFARPFAFFRYSSHRSRYSSGISLISIPNK